MSHHDEMRALLQMEYHQKCLKLGRPPTVMEVNADPTMHSWSCYQKYWGTLKRLLAALDLADFYKQNRGKNQMYTDDLLIRLLNDKYRRDGTVPTTHSVTADPDMPSAEVYYRRFKCSWAEILTKAHIPVNRANAHRSGISNQELLGRLRHKAALLGHVPRRREVDQDASMPNSKTYEAHFGTYFRALLQAGLNPEPAQYHAHFSNRTRLMRKSPAT